MATILAVDDDAANRALAVALLQPLGHAVVEAADADEAEARLRERDVELVLLDLGLPRTSGAQFLRRLRVELKSRVPVVLYTASDPDAATRDLMLAYDASGFIPKPCEPEAFWRVIARALR